MRVKGVLIFLLIIMTFLVLYFGFGYWRYKTRAFALHQYIREYEYAYRSMNLAEHSRDKLQELWGDKLKCEGNKCVIDGGDVITDSYFADHDYLERRPDFHGYEFAFDEQGRVTVFYFYAGH